MSKDKTKMEQEFEQFKDAARNLKGTIVDSSPPWMNIWLDKILFHPGTGWFFLGIGLEAMTITFQYMFMESSYPLIDMVFGIALGMFVLVMQARRNAQSTSS